MTEDHDTGNGFAEGVSPREYWEQAGKTGGRPKLPERKRLVPMKVMLSPWLRNAVEAVRRSEEQRTGRRPSAAQAARGLLQLGVNGFRELGRLPEIIR